MNTGNRLPSQFQIGDEVEYTVFSGSSFVHLGRVVAVRFTKSKVYYDCLSETTAQVTRDIASELVKSLLQEGPPPVESSTTN